ncbi:hypothetical protein ACHAXR_002588, partial [Thalassiosira sp. AJA248-18]
MTADPFAAPLSRKNPAATIIRWLRFSWTIARLLAVPLSSSFTPANGAFRRTHHPAAFAASTNFHQRLRFKHIISRDTTFRLSTMNQDSSLESEDITTQPANKKMRPTPTTTKTPDIAAMVQPKGTLYITVGPQCSGKTTKLKSMFGKSFHKNQEKVSEESLLTKEEEALSALPDGGGGVDITIDDLSLVYIPVPISYFVRNSTSKDAALLGGTNATFPSLNQKIHGKTINERINDPNNEELVSVLHRLGGTLSAEEFVVRIRGSKGSNGGGAKPVQDDLIDAVEHVMQLQQSSPTKGGTDDGVMATLPEMIDLFIVESIFRPRPVDLLQKMPNNGQTTSNHNNTSTSPSETLSALDEALHLIKTHASNPRIHASTAPISWGNTNTRPREFQSALEAAVLSGRPVEFIVFGGMEACDMIREHISRREYRKMSHGHDEENAAGGTNAKTNNAEGENDTEKQSLLCLPKVDRQTLLVRNLQRLLQTGKYIPSNAIADAMVRVESLLTSAVAEANKEYPKEDDNGVTESKFSLSRAKFRLDYELAKLAGYRLNADRTVSSTHGNGQGSRNNGQYKRNNYHAGRGDYRNRHQSGRYNGGRSRGYGGRGGRSSSYSGNNQNHDR